MRERLFEFRLLVHDWIHRRGFTATSQTATTFGGLPGSLVVSAAGTTNGIVWVMDRNANEIHAYDAGSFATELWNSGMKIGGGDSVGAVTKFASPTVANGEVFVGTLSGLVVYGNQPPASQPPAAPSLSASPLSNSSISLFWSDPSVAPNTATGYSIESSTDNVNFTVLTTAPGGSTTISVGGLSSNTTYYFRNPRLQWNRVLELLRGGDRGHFGPGAGLGF